MNLVLIRNIILWAGWIFAIGGTIYILLRGKVVLGLVKGSIIGRLAMGLMFGFFVQTYLVLILCTALLNYSEKSITIVLPVMIVWLIICLVCWRVMRRTRIEAEKIVKG
ncbi:MAG: hypothetical protein NT155_00605 [Candidatus Staskawiczbacteria bacterium]|nr:hypothetical protein [Candidatus Staskawiczbacteria bacterium]